jgi:hypothetical protein
MTKLEELYWQGTMIFGIDSLVARTVGFGSLGIETQDDVERVYRDVAAWAKFERERLNLKVQRADQWLEELKQYYIDSKKEEAKKSIN